VCDPLVNISQSAKLARAADAFFVVTSLADRGIGDHMMAVGVDIVVDLMAHTTGRGVRMETFIVWVDGGGVGGE
jgi:hypothetical protein